MKSASTLVVTTMAMTGVLVLLAGTGVALGGGLNPVDSRGQINACVQGNTGALRVASTTSDCKPAELPLSWQQKPAAAPEAASGRILVNSGVRSAPAMPFYTDDTNHAPIVIAEQKLTVAPGDRRYVKILTVTENEFTLGREPDEEKYGADCGPAYTEDTDGSRVYPTIYPSFQPGFATLIDGKQVGGFGTMSGVGAHLLGAEQLLTAGTYTIQVTVAPMHCYNVINPGSIDPTPTAQIVVFDQGNISAN